MSTIVVGLIPIVLLALVATFGLRGLAQTADDGLSSARQTISTETVSETLIEDAEKVGIAFDRVIAERIDDVVVLARQPAVADPAYLDSERLQRADFVDLRYRAEQVDEPWWLEAFTTGLHIGPVTTDGEATVITIAAQVTDPAGTPVGVLRADLSLSALHEVADAYTSGGRDVAVITATGRLVAETATGHDPARVGAGAIPPGELSTGELTASTSGRGSVTDGDTVYGFATIAWPRTGLATDSVDTAAPFDGEPWHVVVSEPTSVAFAPLDELDELGRDLNDGRGELAAVTVTVLLVSFLACLIAAHIMARKLVTPVRRLTQRAKLLADKDLTAAAARPDDPDLDFASLEDHSIDLNAGNELDELAASFDSVHRTAIQMASEQTHLRQITADMFANLGRRNQSLVKRQLRFIEELERSEEDPDRLASLFKLDHLATRMRRNAESLLVIAGHRGNSRRSNPVRIELVTQAALGEVENFERVDISEVEPAAIMGRAVAGLAHVLAELVENALSFSPPEVPVRVVGERGTSHYTLSVIDRGIGLLPAELRVINERLSLGADSELTSSKQLGLLVVAKLASRYGFQVRLIEAAAGGVAAQIEIPNTLVQPPELGATKRPRRTLSSTARSVQTAKDFGADSAPAPASVPEPTAGLPGQIDRRRPATKRPEQPLPEPVGRRSDGFDPTDDGAPPSHWAPPVVREAQAPPADTSQAGVVPSSVPPSKRAPDRAPAEPPVNHPNRRRDDRPRQDRPASDSSRYVGSLSATGNSQVTSVPRRESRRPKTGSQGTDRRDGDQTEASEQRRTKRAVAVTTSDEQVVDEATDVRNRWNRFRSGQQTAAAKDERSRPPAPDHRRRSDDD